MTDQINRKCVVSCPEGSLVSNNECLESCPNEKPYLVDENEGKACLSICPDGKFGISVKETNSSFCVPNCSLYGKIGNKEGKVCIDSCKSEEYLYISPLNYTQVCMTPCPTPLLGNSKTGKCADSCPEDFFLNEEKFCMENCPTDKFSDNSSKTCQSVCDSSKFIQNGKFCVNSCPSGTFGNISNRVCLPKCENNT